MQIYLSKLPGSFLSGLRCFDSGRTILVACLSLLVLGGTLSAAEVQKSSSSDAIKPPASLVGYALVWNDEFEGAALDAAKWNYRKDSKHLSTQKAENVSVKDGLLHLALKKETAGGKDYTGAGIVSKSAFKYGYYEARLKMPAGAGWHTSFWSMKHDGSGTTDFQDATQGIDIAQNESVDHVSCRVALRKYNPEPSAVYGFSRLSTPDLSADFHMFGCEFTPEAANFYLDGKLVHTVDAKHFPHGDQNLWITSIASHLGSTLQVDDGALPQEVECDYVRVFAKTNGAPSAAPGTNK